MNSDGLPSHLPDLAWPLKWVGSPPDVSPLAAGGRPWLWIGNVPRQCQCARTAPEHEGCVSAWSCISGLVTPLGHAAVSRPGHGAHATGSGTACISPRGAVVAAHHDIRVTKCMQTRRLSEQQSKIAIRNSEAQSLGNAARAIPRLRLESGM